MYELTLFPTYGTKTKIIVVHAICTERHSDTALRYDIVQWNPDTSPYHVDMHYRLDDVLFRTYICVTRCMGVSYQCYNNNYSSFAKA